MNDTFKDDPFIPVVVNKQGEAIRPNSLDFHDRDEFFRANLHERCDGEVKISQVSDSFKVLHCSKCGLRRYFPAKIATYGGLREHFKKALKLRRRKRTTKKRGV